MSGGLLVKESFINADRNALFGEADWYEAYENTPGELYRAARSKYGRCVSKIYDDADAHLGRFHGWVFHKRMNYEDAHRLPRAERTYLREVWVQFRQA